jgi:hypothetical protein
MSAIVGTLVAQLFVLEEGDSGFGYLAVGRPLASLCLVFSICTVVLGAFRAWRHQDAMIRGKALSGGFEIVSLGIICLVVCSGDHLRPWPFADCCFKDGLRLLRPPDCPRCAEARR